MKIGPLNNKEPVTPEINKNKDETNKTTSTEIQKDSIEISDEGRNKLSELQNEKVQPEISKINSFDEVESAKTSRINNRIESDYYNLPEVKEKIVDKLTEEILKDLRQFNKENE